MTTCFTALSILRVCHLRAIKENAILTAIILLCVCARVYVCAQENKVKETKVYFRGTLQFGLRSLSFITEMDFSFPLSIKKKGKVEGVLKLAVSLKQLLQKLNWSLSP